MLREGPRDNVTETQGIANLPVVTQSGQIVPDSGCWPRSC